MKVVISIFIAILFSLKLYAESPYGSSVQDILSGYVALYPYIGFEYERDTRRLIPYDYIHNSYKRVSEEVDTNISKMLNELSSIDIHLKMELGYDFDKKIFYMPNMYLNIGKAFYPHWTTTITPFLTISSKFDISIDDEPNGSISLYDAGIETVFLTRILFSMRTRSVNDINGFSFMLLSSVVDSDSYNEDTPHWYLPRIKNAPGFRAGLIGNYYELSFSQGFWKDSSPMSTFVKFNLEYFEVSAIYQHNNQSSLTPKNHDDSRHLFQISGITKIPILNEILWVNLLLEYTFKSNVAHYIRNEIGIEWNIFNIVIRPIFYLSHDDKNMFLFEYSTYIKYDPFTFGFQGSTDGRYYLMGKVVF